MTGHHPVVEFFALPIEKRRLRFPDRRPGSDAEIRTGADSRRIAPPAVRGRFPSHRFHVRRRYSPPFSSFASPPPGGTSALPSRLPASPIFSNSPRFQARNRSSERHYRVPVPRPIRARRSRLGGHAAAGSRAVAPGCRPVAGRLPAARRKARSEQATTLAVPRKSATFAGSPRMNRDAEELRHRLSSSHPLSDRTRTLCNHALYI